MNTRPTRSGDSTPPLEVAVAAAAAPRRRGGFTLVELLVVMAIIGIILALVLVAGMDAANRANERATQSLITKLERGLNDRLEALLQNQPVPNSAHGYLAAVYSSLATVKNVNPQGMIPTLYIIKPDGTPLMGTNNLPIPNPAFRQTQRAQVMAVYDYVRSEMPDVFFIDPQFYANGTSYTGPYPLNFAAVPMPGTDASNGTLGGLANYVLPLGNTLVNNPLGSSFGDGNTTYPTLGIAGSGIYGAAYEVAAGLYKNLGYLPAGYDGVDNNSNGTIDEWAEGIGGNPSIPAPDNPNVQTTVSALVLARLGNHTHNTARAETLYAVFVGGTGPLGSIFNPDDFTDREVQDTDNDGMPEFVDAWGQPLQFFRWPLLYHSDVQRGQLILPDANNVQTWDLWPPYYDPVNAQNGMFQQREQDALDVNQQLVAPGWWSTGQGTSGIAANDSYPIAIGGPALPAGISGAVQFGALFHTLIEPYPSPGGAAFWDRGGVYGARRAFYSKFLILSSGQDRMPGVFLYSDAAIQGAGLGASFMLIANENSAMPFAGDMADFTQSYTLSNTSFTYNPATDLSNPTNPSSYDLQQYGQDDISNHNLVAGGAIGGSG